ncbi:MAG: DNA polymerase Y family protein [Azonexaceae bacterium]|nr:DNA polymerase Y family protein [Azonexaceae bacterium]
MLWLALHFPLLPLEALPLRQSPSAVVARGRVLVGDAEAVAAGVCAGQKLSTALGLQPGLSVFERVEAREKQALDSLACWAGCFTPTISLVSPDTLLLEIGGCLRLFGGVEAIVTAVLAGCAEQAYSSGWAVAPTPLGANWLARAGAARIYPEPAVMQAALADLPCAIPGWPDEAANRLESFGLRQLGDLRKLPGAGLRRRIGNGPVDDLLRAWGDLPDPQKSFVFPESFALDIELPSRVEHAEALVFVGQRLFAALAGWLHGRQLLVRRCSLQLTHDDGPPTSLALNFAEPAADEGRFVRLLREHLSRLHLTAPVEALRLQADELVDKPGASAHLFEQAPAGEGTLACLERLRARLGEGAVQALGEVADHRPECATGMQEVNFNFGRFSRLTVKDEKTSPQPADSHPSRPLWLLPTPQALTERAGSPQWHGPLKLLSRAERLESGWWDEGEGGATGDVRRDYFVARNPLGQWAWVFRNADGWFLHGLFA